MTQKQMIEMLNAQNAALSAKIADLEGRNKQLFSELITANQFNRLFRAKLKGLSADKPARKTGPVVSVDFSNCKTSDERREAMQRARDSQVQA